MHYFRNQISRLSERLRQRQARRNRLMRLHNLLLLSEAEMAELDVSRNEIRRHLLRLHLGAASVSLR